MPCLDVMLISRYGSWTKLTDKGKSDVVRRTSARFPEMTWPTDAQLDIVAPALTRVADASDKIDRAGSGDIIFANLAVIGNLKALQGAMNAQQFEHILALNGGKWKDILHNVERETSVNSLYLSRIENIEDLTFMYIHERPSSEVIRGFASSVSTSEADRLFEQ
jgi:hypothetical protein